MNKNIIKIASGLTLVAGVFTACSEEIDESARYTFTGETVTDYVTNNPQFSVYNQLIHEVPVSDYSESTVAQLLSARGNFVVFAPTNGAIKRYLETVKEKGIIDVNSFEEITDEKIADSLKKVVVHNSVVDLSEYLSVFAYIGDIAPSGNETSKLMTYSNMNNRYLTIEKQVTVDMVDDETGETISNDSYIVQDAYTFKCDIQVYNGVVHEMYNVVAPSNDNMLDILANSPDFSAFANLVKLCGLNDTLSKIEDEVYHELYWTNPSQYKAPYHKTQKKQPNSFEQRLYGFTAFIEPNDVYEKAELLNAEGKVDLDKLKDYLQAYQPNGLSQGEDYTDENNWLNFFVTYHLLPAAVDFDHLVIHYNELGYYRPSSSNSGYTITQTEYFQPMGKPRLLTISEGGDNDTLHYTTHGKRINYHVTKNRNNLHPFDVSGYCSDERGQLKGILVSDPTTLKSKYKFEDPINGRIYPIEELLVYTPGLAKVQGSQRMRYDVAALFPELASNSVRRRYSEIGDYGFTKNYAYLSNMSWSDESNVYYLPGYSSGWQNYQGDEFNITGIYDVTVKLFPVPYSTTYELRIGVSVNPTRGMMQVYFGTDPNGLPAAGIPLDMRVGGIIRYNDWNGSSKSKSNIGWEEDTEDQSLNDDVDKKMRLNGFMKAPAGFAKSSTPGLYDVINESLRNNCENYLGDKGTAVRRIVVKQDMQAGETYYIRFKSVLDNENSQFFFDYLELVPKEVYDNPVNPEDIW